MFKKEKFIATEKIYLDKILYNNKDKEFFIKNGFLKQKINLIEIQDIGIQYGGKLFLSDKINQGKNIDGGIERFFSGKYSNDNHPKIEIVIQLKNGKRIYYPITLSSTSAKQRMLFVAEDIYDKIINILEGKNG